ncbi:MAG: redoxin domain-containing protein [Verrucomicrobiaceae bacterium]|nr:redoxin domain-containing protein [Verrucomicrobiaceae bacterium]
MKILQTLKFSILLSLALTLLLPFLAAQDAYMRDNPSDAGIEPNPSAGPMWTSPDIWVRRNPDPNWVPYPHPTASPTWTPQPHQNPEYRERDFAQPNYVYVRVTNRGTSATDGTERLRVYWAKASTGLNWPDHWIGAVGNSDADTYYANDCGVWRVFGKEITKPRKKASTATADEKQIYADAVVALDSAVHPGSTETYFDLQDMVHSMGHAQHFNDAFVAWHREFVNRYEQALLKQDPRVTLLYWDWHENPNIAGYNFMGSFGGTNSVAGTTLTPGTYDTLSDRGAPVQPFANFAPSTSPLGGAPTIRVTVAGSAWELWRGPFNAGLQSLLKPDTTVLQATDYGNFAYDPPAFAIPGDPMLQTPVGDVQSNPHNPAHVTHGNLYNGTTTSVSWPNINGLANLGGAFNDAAEDPFFFMLHGNVDRLWAQWQRDQSLTGYSLDRLTQAQAYNGANTASGSEMGGTIGPWDGVADLDTAIAPWTAAGGYINAKPYNHASVYSPPVYDTAPLYVPVLQPGESTIVQIPWYPPNPDDFDCFGPNANQKGHFCLLARIETDTSSPYGMTFLEGAGIGANVRNNNNIAWKNLTVVDDFSGLGLAGVVGGIVVRNIDALRAATATLQFNTVDENGETYQFNQAGTMTVDIPQAIFQGWQRAGAKGEGLRVINDTGTIEILQPGARMFNIQLGPGEFFGATPQFQLGENRHNVNKRRFRLNVLQIQDDQVVGGNTYNVDFEKIRLIKVGSRWTYQDGGVAAAQGWHTADFKDEGWKVGNADFGYQVDDAQVKYSTRLDTYRDLRNPRAGQARPIWQDELPYEPIVTTYFRHEFQSAGGDAYRSLTLRTKADDGLIVYINGVEVSRYCLQGNVQHDTYAEESVEGAQENFYRTYDISNFLHLLNPGNNVIAAELHQAKDSYDAVFDLELFADGPEQLDMKPTVAVDFRPYLERGPGLHDSVHCLVGGTMCSVRSQDEAIPLLVDAVDDREIVATRVYLNGQLYKQTQGGRIETNFFTRGLHNNGAITVRAEAVDDAGNVGSVERVIRVVDNLPPLVEIESIGRRPIVRAGESIRIQVDARDLDGEVAKVRFYYKSCASPLGVPAALFGEIAEPPYVATAKNLHAGAQIFTVQVEDNDGATVEESFTLLGARLPELAVEASPPNGAMSINWDQSVLQSATLQSSTDLLNWTDVSNATVPVQVSTREDGANYYRLSYDLNEAIAPIGFVVGPVNENDPNGELNLNVGPIVVNLDVGPVNNGGGGVIVDPGDGGVIVDPGGGQLGGNGPIVGAAVAADKWQLPDRSGNPQSLDDFRGEPLVMLFFLGHDCLSCLEQLEAMKVAHSTFESAGVNVVAVSPDSVEDLAQMQEFPFAILSDADLSVFNSYGVKDADGEPTHAVVIIGGDGQLVLRELSDLPDMNLDRILSLVGGQ